MCLRAECNSLSSELILVKLGLLKTWEIEHDTGYPLELNYVTGADLIRSMTSEHPQLSLGHVGSDLSDTQYYCLILNKQSKVKYFSTIQYCIQYSIIQYKHVIKYNTVLILIIL